MVLKVKLFYIILFNILILSGINGQLSTIKGKISDSDGEALLGSSVVVTNKGLGAVADGKGNFSIKIPSNEICYIQCSFLGYETVYDTVTARPGQEVYKNFSLNKKVSELEGVTVFGIQEREKTLTRINMKSIDQLPNTSGNIESILKSFAGVVSGNELSSQYSVRGGSYDENLIYVNDIEIHRPLLVQSAMQEGLSFVNPSMVSGIQFSAGGFDAEYGDKMSSVLDITYKKPTEFEGTATASLLGASVHLAGATKDGKFNFNTGLRYKTSQYLLSSLDVKGEYVPRFTDIQALLNYNFTPKTSLSLLGNYSTNRFSMTPESRETKFGVIQRVIRLTSFYEGTEKDAFDSYMAALSLNHTVNDNLTLKFIGSTYSSNEEVTYDILSEYYLSQISKSSNNTDTAISIGTGSSLEHARKYLSSTITSFEHKGNYFASVFSWKWGLRLQYESIDDEFNEWRFLDSIGMSIPYSDEYILLDYAEAAHNKINSLRYQAFLQNSVRLNGKNTEYGITYGVRANYWDYNDKLLVSPRASLTIKPGWERRVEFYFASGLYGQPPFYKELKDYTGKLFPERRAQKSIHFVFGTDYYYTMWDRPFIFTTEVYYKHLYDIIPYKVNNIQVQYMPEFKAKGYATGIDLRVYGEFVPGTESWFSLSLLRTREEIPGYTFMNYEGVETERGVYRRPTDQTLTFSIFFQDYLPMNPDFKVHLLVNYGTGLPYSGPTPNRPGQVFVLNQYRRVDIGFSRIIKRKKEKKIGLNDIWLSFEILNLLDAQNMSSYDWVRTVENTEGVQDTYAVPNYLTGRRFNVKISTKL